MEIKDLAGLSAPLQKLLQTVADGLGAIAYPWLVRREAKALADAQKTLTEAGLTLESATMKNLPAQIAARVTYQEVKRQKNLGQVVDAARAALPEGVSEAPVDPDWTNRFFATAQDVSNEQMQQVWGRLLAGEVARPGSFSLRTLDCLRNMTSSEAKLFSEVCEFAFETSWDAVFIIYEDPSIPNFGNLVITPNEFSWSDSENRLRSIYNNRGLSEPSFRLLTELGLISTVPGDGLRFSGNGKSPFRIALRSGKQRLLIAEHDNTTASLVIPIARLTIIGRELFQLHIPGATPEFDALLNETLSHVGFRVRWQPFTSTPASATASTKPNEVHKPT
jgi:uncharacterized repeat protein (TIGR03899 family)